MKKTMFAAVAALVLAGSLAAQPTVHSNCAACKLLPGVDMAHLHEYIL